MTQKRCDVCGVRFDESHWYPVAFEPTTPAIREFCSIECKRSFLADSQ